MRAGPCESLLMTVILRVDNAGCGRPPRRDSNVHYLFYVRNMFLFDIICVLATRTGYRTNVRPQYRLHSARVWAFASAPNAPPENLRNPHEPMPLSPHRPNGDRRMTLLSKTILGATLGASVLALTAASASAAVVCSGNVCWH